MPMYPQNFRYSNVINTLLTGGHDGHLTSHLWILGIFLKLVILYFFSLSRYLPIHFMIIFFLYSIYSVIK